MSVLRWRDERRWLGGAARHVVRTPRLWLPAARATKALVPRAWWTRRPFLPVPDRRYMAFRVSTFAGTTDRRPTPAEVESWIKWSGSIQRPR